MVAHLPMYVNLLNLDNSLVKFESRCSVADALSLVLEDTSPLRIVLLIPLSRS